MADKLKVAVIGLTIGIYHVMDYMAHPSVGEMVICDINQEKLEEAKNRFNIEKCYTDYKELLEKERPDIVSVCVSNFMHKQICIDALKNGANVLCEKPLARNNEECEEIIKTSKLCGKKLMVNFNRRYNNDSIALKKIVDSGKLGEIYYATTSWKRSRGVPWWYPLNNAKEKCGGGAFIDLGVHMLDLCMWLCGYPDTDYVMGKTFQKVSMAEAHKRGYDKFDAEDMGVAMISMKNGMMLETEISWASNSEIKFDLLEVRLYGTKGGAVITEDGTGQKTALFISDDNGATKVENIEVKEINTNVRSEFVDAVVNDTPVPCPPEEAAEISKIIDAVYRSSEKCKPVKV